MSITMPESVPGARIRAAGVRLVDDATRTDLSVAITLDVDLVLGSQYEIPEDLGDQDHDDDVFAAFAGEYARVAALVDMIDEGFVNIPQAVARLAVVVAELELADDADGYDHDVVDQALRGWVA
ncbi:MULTISPECIES: hypothetical protein [Streptacidiphilus]|uniref:Uncharacterized protein n=1 Tax=Streptacidiphilus cavernicola TaxID=3342716 RepID=A0ABV6UWF2_9ACTN|nr:hypothetical protein [Streptacidiphilus jeojiense]